MVLWVRSIGPGPRLCGSVTVYNVIRWMGVMRTGATKECYKWVGSNECGD